MGFFDYDYEDDFTLLGDSAIESEIVLAAIREHCDSAEEFNDLLQDTAIEMGMYGVIDDAEAAMEASKKIVIKDYKAAKFNAIAGRTALRLAAKANDAEYKKYVKYRNLMIDSRNKIYKKYGAKAKTEAKKIMQNARRKASNMDSKGSKSIVDKIDREISNQSKK